MISIDDKYLNNFHSLFCEEGLDRLDDLMTGGHTFDEVPLYSRTSQVEFLSKEPLHAQNNILIRAAVWYLPQILAHADRYFETPAEQLFCMVSITGWDEYETGGIIIPNFWLTHPRNGILELIELEPPRTTYSNVVHDALELDEDYSISEGWRTVAGHDFIERIYIQTTLRQ